MMFKVVSAYLHGEQGNKAGNKAMKSNFEAFSC